MFDQDTIEDQRDTEKVCSGSPPHLLPLLSFSYMDNGCEIK